MKLIAEKSFCRGVAPVLNVKNNPVQYPLAVKHKKFLFACGNGILGARNLMILDVIGTELIHRVYGNKSFSDRIPLYKEPQVKKMSGLCMSQPLLEFMAKKLSPANNGIIPESWYSDDGKLYEIDKEKWKIKKAPVITLNDGILRRELSCLRKYTSLEIQEMIKQTSEVILWMNFPVRYYNGKRYKTFPFNNYRLPSKLFTLKEIRITKISKDKHILEREYVIQLNTILGYMYSQNLSSSWLEFLPDRFYSMSEYAQFFYRLFILTYYPSKKNGKSPHNPISLSCISDRLVLRSKNKTMNKTVVRRILKELTENNFISNPREKKEFGGDYFYSWQKNDWKSIAGEEETFETEVDIL